MELAERCAGHGVHVVWLAAGVRGLPAVCRYFVAVEHGQAGEVGSTGTGERIFPVRLKRLGAATVLEVARGLAPLVDTDAGRRRQRPALRGVPAGGADRPLTAVSSAIIEQWAASWPGPEEKARAATGEHGTVGELTTVSEAGHWYVIRFDNGQGHDGAGAGADQEHDPRHP